jgi:hypothetical protein
MVTNRGEEQVLNKHASFCEQWSSLPLADGRTRARSSLADTLSEGGGIMFMVVNRHPDQVRACCLWCVCFASTTRLMCAPDAGLFD